MPKRARVIPMSRMTLPQIKRAVKTFSRAELESFDEWLHRLIKEARAEEKEKERAKRKSKVIEERIEGARVLRLELVQCGKANCRCASGGKGHGPYWYEYHREGERVRKEYIGKNLKK